jgi:hypothetical protein
MLDEHKWIEIQDHITRIIESNVDTCCAYNICGAAAAGYIVDYFKEIFYQHHDNDQTLQ